MISGVIPGLGIPQFRVFPAQGMELFMAAPLYDFPLVEYQDLIAELAAAHPVGDIDSCLAFHQLLEARVDFRLRYRI